jgi:hypothetical protein
MTMTTATLENLLPTVHRLRDAQQGGPLRALLGLMAAQGRLVEEDIAQLLEDSFIETCAEWVVPYIGELVGVRGLRDLGPDAPYSRRALVANVIAYRRRKGTVPVVEQLVLDSAGWAASASEAFLQMGWSQHLNHVRLGDAQAPGGTASLRDATALQTVGGAFDPLSYSADLRSIAGGRGRWNLPHLAVFAWRLQSYRMLRAMPRAAPQPGRFWFDPAGRDLQLFNPPQTETGIAQRSTELNLPAPLRRAPLYLEQEARRFAAVNGTPALGGWLDDRPTAAGQPAFRLWLDGLAVPTDQLQVCDLSDWHQPADSVNVPQLAPDGTVTPVAWPIAAAIDPELGRLSLAPARAGSAVQLDWNYGFPGDLGGGAYDRRRSLEAVLDRPVAWQLGVSREQSPLAGELVATLGEAIDAWLLQPPGTVGLIVLMDNASWTQNLTGARTIVVPSGSRLVIAAADWPALAVPGGLPGQLERRPGRIDPGLRRAHLQGNIEVEGSAPPDDETAGELVLDGLLIEGRVRVLAGNLARLRLAHCTVLPDGGSAVISAVAGAAGDNDNLRLELERCITGGLNITAPAERVQAIDSVVQGTGNTLVCEASPVELVSCTVVGRSRIDRLCAENCLFTGRVTTARLQEGCVRYSYIPPTSSVPRPYRCQPALAVEAAPLAQAAAVRARLAPGFTSLTLPEAAYAQLSTGGAPELATGAEDGNEMGAWRFLLQAHRQANARGQIEDYLRFGMQAGLIYAT